MNTTVRRAPAAVPVLVAVLLAASLASAPVVADTLPVAKAVVETIKRQQRFDGVVEAVHRSTVSAETSGRIVELPYDIDDYVPEDAVIVRFDDARQEAQLASARANLEQARARLTQARADFERMKQLVEKGTVSQSEFERAEADYRSAQARVDAAAGELDQAREEMERTVVRAPYAGVVIERHVEMGEMARPGTSLMTGLSLEQLRVVVDVPQQFIGALREHEEATILTPGGEEVQPETLRIFPYADARTHTFRVRAVLPEGRHGVFPGMLVKVAFTTGREALLLVPADALVRRSELTAVYVQDGQDDSLSFRQVRVGRRVDERIQVLAGLESGERVVLDPVAAGIAYKEQSGNATQ